MFQGSVLATSEGSHMKAGGSGKAMPQFEPAAADNTHRSVGMGMDCSSSHDLHIAQSQSIGGTNLYWCLMPCTSAEISFLVNVADTGVIG